jgi:tetraacyldisaccharide 4'-kinase
MPDSSVRRKRRFRLRLTLNRAADYNIVGPALDRETHPLDDIPLTLWDARIDLTSYHDLLSGQCRGLRPALQRAGLHAASMVYGTAVGLRNLLYDRGWKQSRRAPVPVVGVGNLTVGGTGKTPCVEYVARFYRQLDCRVAILSRGYGARGGCNDEALLLEENLPDVPHLQGADRFALAAIAVEELESEVLVLDDGFQHRQLARDLDLVLIDATRPWGYGHLLPRGLLRESPAGLRRAGMVVLTRTDQVEEDVRGRLRGEIARQAPGVPLAETVHRPMEWMNGPRTAPLDIVAGRPVLAFCGIGNPDAFRRTLAGIGVNPVDFRAYPDHHGYTRADVEDLRTWARRTGEDAAVVTTQKDLVKLRLARLGDRELWALRVGLAVVAREDSLATLLRSVIRPG